MPSLFTMEEACRRGNLDAVHYFYQNNIHGDHECCVELAAERGNMDVLKFLLQHHYPCTARAVNLAARSGHTLMLIIMCNYDARTRTRCVTPETATCAAFAGSITCLRYVCSTLRVRPTERALCAAVRANSISCLQFLLDVCRLPVTHEAMRLAAIKKRFQCMQMLFDKDPFVYLKTSQWLVCTGQKKVQQAMDYAVLRNCTIK